MIRKSLMLAYAGIAYFLSMTALLYVVGFLADCGVPKGISDGKAATFWPSVLIDAGLIGLFGLHYSVTARTSFERWWTRFIPAPIERATYLYMTAIMTAILIYFWQPLPHTIWHARANPPRVHVISIPRICRSVPDDHQYAEPRATLPSNQVLITDQSNSLIAYRYINLLPEE